MSGASCTFETAAVVQQATTYKIQMSGREDKNQDCCCLGSKRQQSHIKHVLMPAHPPHGVDGLSVVNSTLRVSHEKSRRGQTCNKSSAQRKRKIKRQSTCQKTTARGETASVGSQNRPLFKWRFRRIQAWPEQERQREGRPR